MKQLDIINQLSRELSELVTEIEAHSAMQLYDINIVAENVVLSLFQELWNLPNLRNLNAEEKKNFPGIDLADDVAKLAIQVTTTPSIEKIKSTLETFVRHGLQASYTTLYVYVLSRKQGSYSKKATDVAAGGKFSFNPDTDVLDFRDLLAKAPHAKPQKVKNALDVVVAYRSGAKGVGLLEADFDPPILTETTQLNLVEVYFPHTLYVADLLPSVTKGKTKIKFPNWRNIVRTTLKNMGYGAPTEFEATARRVITFDALDDSNSVWPSVIDMGTVTSMGSQEFASIDEDHERIFKSLLRRSLQNKLFRQAVHWMHEDGLFAFMPLNEKDFIREVTWHGKKANSRTVYERKINKNDASKTFTCKHFAFSAEFLRSNKNWYVALTPEWYFSRGDEAYSRSSFADENISWLKRKENNQVVNNHFRFIATWLLGLDSEDLFQSSTNHRPVLSFGDVLRFENSPLLDDSQWLPPSQQETERDDLYKNVALFEKL